MPWIDLDGTSVHFREEGDGEALLFLHAFPLHAGMWDAEMHEFAGSRRTLCFDARGFGRSGPARGTLSMNTIADDAAAVLAACGATKATVVGLSMGGYAALAMWRRHPELIRALVLADTKAPADSAEGKAGRAATAERVLDQGAEAFAQDLVPKLLAPGADGRVADRVRRMIAEATPNSIAEASLALGAREDSTATLATITVPTLIIVGEKDAITPRKEADALAAAIKGASVAEIAGAGHLSNLEMPSAFEDALGAFLDAQPDPPASSR